jgi:hypothetical protein
LTSKEKIKAEIKVKEYIINDIPVTLDFKNIQTRLHFYSGKKLSDEDIRRLKRMIEATAKPKALYKANQVNRVTGNSLQIGEVVFSSPLLRVNLGRVKRAWPFIVTIGQEVNSLSIPECRPDLIYSLEVLKEMLLHESINYLQTHIATQHNLPYLWQLTPGYFQAWPESGRKQIFFMFSHIEPSIGVELLEDYSFFPRYSECGIFYHAEVEFESCQVCPQEPCMGRRAPYSEELARHYADKAGKPCGFNRRFMTSTGR